jgi:hypothetical protein
MNLRRFVFHPDAKRNTNQCLRLKEEPITAARMPVSVPPRMEINIERERCRSSLRGDAE